MHRIRGWFHEENAKRRVASEQDVDEVLVAPPDVVPRVEREDDELAEVGLSHPRLDAIARLPDRAAAYSASSRSTWRAMEYFVSTIARPCSDATLRASSGTNDRSASAAETGSSGRNRRASGSSPTVSRWPPPPAATTGTPAAIASSTPRPRGSAGAGARKRPARANSSDTTSFHPANVTSATAFARTQSSRSLRWEPSPTIRSVHPSFERLDACQARRAVSVSFSFSSRCMTRTTRLSTLQRRGDGGTPFCTIASGRCSRFCATNSLIAICRVSPDPIHGARTRPHRVAPRRAAKWRVLTTGGPVNGPRGQGHRFGVGHVCVTDVLTTGTE